MTDALLQWLPMLAALLAAGALGGLLAGLLGVGGVSRRRPGAGGGLWLRRRGGRAEDDAAAGPRRPPPDGPAGTAIPATVGTGSALGLWISVPATVVSLFARAPDAADLPLTVGYVSLLTLAVIAPASRLIAPLARFAHSIPRRSLSVVLGVFLLIVAARMLRRTLR